ncbi:MAG: hypothetical protein LQ346_001488 [Caloplaca aetnensis]|nr:MAG: hypothetical protein LQ346_001488 [Caloplaca aetnensis]
MAPIRIPQDGLSLQGAPCSSSAGDLGGDEAQAQVMRLDLAGGVLGDIMKASRMGKDIHMSFGKSVVCPPSLLLFNRDPRLLSITEHSQQTIHYGNRTQQLLSIAQPTPSELYKYSPNAKDELRFAGNLTHKLAQKKVQENTAGADAALAALQSKMASHQQNKQSKQYVNAGSEILSG